MYSTSRHNVAAPDTKDKTLLFDAETIALYDMLGLQKQGQCWPKVCKKYSKPSAQGNENTDQLIKEQLLRFRVQSTIKGTLNNNMKQIFDFIEGAICFMAFWVPLSMFEHLVSPVFYLCIYMNRLQFAYQQNWFLYV